MSRSSVSASKTPLITVVLKERAAASLIRGGQGLEVTESGLADATDNLDNRIFAGHLPFAKLGGHDRRDAHTVFSPVSIEFAPATPLADPSIHHRRIP